MPIENRAQFSGPAAGRCVVRIGGRPLRPESHAIVIADQPTPQERWAAADLQRHLKALTGNEIPLLPDSQAGERAPIVVGRSALLKKLGVQIDFDSLGLEGIAIKTAGPALVLAGNKRGVLYAVYTFLEDYLNCRWFTPACAVLPSEGVFDLPPLDRRYVPALEYREIYYIHAWDADWAVRNKLHNGTLVVHGKLDEGRGGTEPGPCGVHTFDDLVPPKQYFRAHPEYYSEVNGQRIGPEHTQLCLTNPDARKIAVATLRRWFQERPPAITMHSVSQNDWWNYCQCASCRALAEQEGSPAGPLIHFVNALADAVKDEYPDKIIETLAYQYSRPPPKYVRPRPNVMVRLCSIECSFAQPLETSPQNAAFRADLAGWNKICPRLYVWDYVINFTHMLLPHPNLQVLQPNIRFFVKNGVKGVFEQGNGLSRGGEFAELRAWLLAKLLWDPEADALKLTREFLAGYYGDAAPYIGQYLDLMRAVVERDNTYLDCYMPAEAPFLSPPVMAEAGKLFDLAEEAVADDRELLERVQTARLAELYARIARADYRQAGDALIANRERGPALERFAEIARAAKVTYLGEGSPGFDDWLAALRQRPAELQLECLRNSALEAFILPFAGGRIWRLRYRPRGKDLIRELGREGSFLLTEGNHEEYSQSGYRSPGWNETYQVRQRSANGVILQADLENGLGLRRSYELDRDQPVIRITSSLKNQAAAARPACLRIHPAFAVADWRRAAVWKKTRDGQWQRLALAAPTDPLQGNEIRLQGDARPAGAWILVDETDDVGVLNRFQLDQVDVCYLHWSGKINNRVNLELWSPSRDLPAGATMEIQHSYEVVYPASRIIKGLTNPKGGGNL